MENIELVIKIPKKWLNDMKREEFINVDELCEIILHGTKIPKGHGRLIDADALKISENYDGIDAMNAIYSASTLIEADKTGRR